jgi:hypothetical protein
VWDDDSVNSSNYDSTTVTPSEMLMTNFEIARDSEYGDKTFKKISGFIVPPVNGNYQFHMSCDDACKLYLSTSNPLDPTQDSTSTIIDRSGGSTSYNFRDFEKTNYESDVGASDNHVGSVYSVWETLTAD